MRVRSSHNDGYRGQRGRVDQIEISLSDHEVEEALGDPQNLRNDTNIHDL